MYNPPLRHSPCQTLRVKGQRTLIQVLIAGLMALDIDVFQVNLRFVAVFID